MIRVRSMLRRLRRDRRGSYALEFGLIATPFLLMIFAALDFGWHSFAQSVVQGELDRAARASETGRYTNTQIDAMVTNGLKEFMRSGTVTITRKSYQDFGHVRPETMTFDANADGDWDTGDCYIDANVNSRWDADMGSTGQGGAVDIVLYNVTFSYPGILPINGFIGGSSTETITNATLVRNQPYAAQSSYGYQDTSTPRCT